MTQTEVIINKELAKLTRGREFVKAELLFINKWLSKDPGNMKEYLEGRRAGLGEVKEILS